jgi:small-conductance mechanosensitive channel
MNGQNLLDAYALGAARLLSGLVIRVYGEGATSPLVGPFSFADMAASVLVFIATLVVNALIGLVLRRNKNAPALDAPGAHELRPGLLRASVKPLHLAIIVCGAYLAVAPLLLKLPGAEDARIARQAFEKMVDCAVFAVLLWLFLRSTRVVEKWLVTSAGRTKSKIDDILAPVLARSLRVIVPVVGIILALPVIGLSQEYAAVVSKASGILIIGAVAWILANAIRVGEQVALAKYDITAPDNLLARKVYTQIHVISKSLYALLAIFAAASVLMLFDEARRFGASILASAGVVGVVVGFAAQRAISNIFAGFQIALTQPIRMDDVLIVESEWGRVEEITLTYVVLHLWDDRRLIVPLSYFIEKPFQNWTRVSASLLGTVLLWVDYTLPIAETRQAVQQIVENSALWDRRFWNLQVSDATERCLQIRVLATAADSSKAWDLRCEIREKLVEFVQRRHPESLPTTRVSVSRPEFAPLDPARPA